jgi:hypothetical protein
MGHDQLAKSNMPDIESDIRQSASIHEREQQINYFDVSVNTTTAKDFCTKLHWASICRNGIGYALEGRTRVAQSINTLQPHAMGIDSSDLRGDVGPYGERFSSLVISKFATE